jgi:2-haloacid dehalogenase
MDQPAILFDINETVLDLTTLQPKFIAVFGSESTSATWFSSLLHSSTVCALTGIKTDFASLAGAMLDNLSARLGKSLSDSERDEILGGFAHLPAHKDVKPALQRLRDANYHTVAFSNSSLNLIEQQIENAGLTNYYDSIVSVERSGTFKPDPRAYQYVAQHLGRSIGNLRLIATHDWDTHGALSAGMMAGYVDRSGAPYHPLYRRPNVYAKNLEKVVDQVLIHDA